MCAELGSDLRSSGHGWGHRFERDWPGNRDVAEALVGLGDVREAEAITRYRADDLRPWARSSPRHQDLREGSASEALLLDDVELQVLIEICEWAAARTDGNRDRR